MKLGRAAAFAIVILALLGLDAIYGYRNPEMWLAWACYTSVLVSTLIVLSQLAALPVLLGRTTSLRDRVIERIDRFKVTVAPV